VHEDLAFICERLESLSLLNPKELQHGEIDVASRTGAAGKPRLSEEAELLRNAAECIGGHIVLLEEALVGPRKLGETLLPTSTLASKAITLKQLRAFTPEGAPAEELEKHHRGQQKLEFLRTELLKVKVLLQLRRRFGGLSWQQVEQHFHRGGKTTQRKMELLSRKAWQAVILALRPALDLQGTIEESATVQRRADPRLPP